MISIPRSTSDFKRPRRTTLLFLGVLFCDQLLKICSRAAGIFRENHGSLFGLETDPLLAVIALGAFIYIARRGIREDNDGEALPLALILSGILSNTVDRISLGFVVDYIDFFGLCIFNLADMAIAIGALFFVWRIVQE